MRRVAQTLRNGEALVVGAEGGVMTELQVQRLDHGRRYPIRRVSTGNSQRADNLIANDRGCSRRYQRGPQHRDIQFGHFIQLFLRDGFIHCRGLIQYDTSMSPKIFCAEAAHHLLEHTVARSRCSIDEKRHEIDPRSLFVAFLTCWQRQRACHTPGPRRTHCELTSKIQSHNQGRTRIQCNRAR